MTDIETTTILSPATGEILTLDAPTESLAEWLADVRDFENQLRSAKRAVTTELLERMDRSAAWTEHVNGLKITGQSPSPEEHWDGAELRAALLELVDEGVLTITAVDNAVETIVSYRPRKAGITALRKVGGRVAVVVDALCSVSERERRVTVSRS